MALKKVPGLFILSFLLDMKEMYAEGGLGVANGAGALVTVPHDTAFCC